MNKKILLWIIVLMALSSFVSADLLTDNTLYYSFDTGDYSGNNVFDLSNNNHIGINDGSTLGSLTGIINYSASFDGSNDKVNINNTLGTYSEFTINIWSSDDFSQNSVDAAISNAAGSDAVRIYYFTTSGTKLFQFSVDGSLYQYGETPANLGVNDGAFHLYTITWNGTNPKVYVDAVLKNTGSSYTGTFNLDSVTNQYLGYWNGVGRPKKGGIDEVSIYNRSLTLEEIEDYYNASLNPYDAYTLEVSLKTPINNYIINNTSFIATYNVTASNYNISTCKIYLNDTLYNTTTINALFYNGTQLFSSLSEGSGQTWGVWCNNTNGDEHNATARTFTIDLTSPSLTDNIINNSMYYNENITGSLNFSDNIDLDYVNITIDGSTAVYYNSSLGSTLNYNLNYDISSLSIGEHTLNIEIYDGVNTQTYEYDFYNLNVSETYDAIAFNTIQTTLEATIDFGTLEASLFAAYTPYALIDFNGTNYTATLDSYTVSGATFSYDVTLGLNPVDRTIPHKWYFNFTTLTDGYISTSSLNQTFTDQSANITLTFYDELDNSLMNTTTISIDFIADTYAYNFTTTTGTLTTPLFFPESYIIRYYATGYTERFHYFSISNETSQSIDLYLLNDGNSTDVTATVYNEIGVKLEGVRIKVQKYDVTTNTYKQVESSDTNFEGETILHLELNEEYYKFILEYPAGTIRQTTTPTYVFTNTLTFQIDTGEDIGDEFYTFQSVSANLTYNPSTYNFKLLFNDVTGLSTQVCLDVTKNGIAYNSSCLSATSGTILVGITNTTGVYRATAYLVYGGENYHLASNIQKIGAETPNTSLGLYFIGFITMVFIFVGFWNLSIALMLTPIPLLIGSYLKLTGIGLGIAISIEVLFIILAFVVSRRSN